MPSPNESRESKGRATRIVMSGRDKEDIRVNLVRNFMTCGGATRKEAESAAQAGSPSMAQWISRWICHHTEYSTTREMTTEMFQKGLYAWIHYKATAEVLEDLSVPKSPVKYP